MPHKNYIRKRAIELIFIASVDIILVNLCYILSFLIRYAGELPYWNFQAYKGNIICLSFLTPVAYFLCGMYERKQGSWNSELEHIAKGIGLNFLMSLSASFILRAFAFPRTVLALSVLLQFIIISLWRYQRWVHNNHLSTRRLLVIGSADEIRRAVLKARTSPQDSVSIDACLTTSTHETITIVPTLGTLERVKVEEVISDYDGALICSSVDYDKRVEITIKLVELDKYIYICPTANEVILSTSHLSSIGDMPALVISESEQPTNMLIVKRLIDIIISSIALLVLSPILIIIAICIKVTSPNGPILYSQERVGRGGRIFTLNKFRTMVPDAEKKTGPVFAGKNDTRITPFGNFLRKSRLDELPQFINILRGDMSIVGPRPERMFFVEQFSSDIPEYNLRLKVPAGLTGLAQVMGNYDTEVVDKLAYDIAYMKSWSILKDLEIMVRTAGVMTRRDKAN